MEYKHWSSPFPIEASLHSALDDAGLEHHPWEIIGSINLNDLLIIFDPPDLVLTHYSNQETHSNWVDDNINQLSKSYDQILSQASRPSTTLIAGWQLTRVLQTISLKELFSSNEDHLSSLQQDSIEWPNTETFAALGIDHLDRKINQDLSNLYIKVDAIAVRFGRQADTMYLQRLHSHLDEISVVKALQHSAATSRREALLIEGLHKIQNDYRDYVMESKEIIKNYQQLLLESQVLAGQYRDATAKNDQDIKAS